MMGCRGPKSVMVRPCWECLVHFKRDRDKQQGPEAAIKMVRRVHDQREDMGMSNWGRGLKGQMIVVFKLLKGC